ncbi:MAG TPA: vitamin K epoxide reductase family protein [Candidatus Bathyarchaeia archaeon]|nr:vitamin K epoxide reductase family protein [Candidatus Bathyarchaeia archaeon]
MMPLVVIALIGCAMSVYMLYLERALEQNYDYKAACDLSDYVSCSKVAKSPYSKIFGMQSGLISLVVYGIIAMCAFKERIELVMYLSGAMVVASVYLAYLIFFKIKAACPLCISMYVVNILLFILSYRYTH